MHLQPFSSPSSLLLLLLPSLLPTLTTASPVTTTAVPQSIPCPPWIPIATIIPDGSPAGAGAAAAAESKAKLELRHPEIVGDPALAAPPTIPTQVSPVTTLMVWQTGAPGAPAQQVQVVYSQSFEAVPDQWEDAQAGSVGLGTIKGTVGAVKTVGARMMEKREAEPEPEPEAFVILPPGPGVVSSPWLEKRKGGKGGSGGGEEESGALGRVTPSLAAAMLLASGLVVVVIL